MSYEVTQEVDLCSTEVSQEVNLCSTDVSQEELNILYAMMIQLESALKDLNDNMDEVRKAFKEMK